MPDDTIAEGIATVRWPGRLERISESPAVFLDGTHNPAGARGIGGISGMSILPDGESIWCTVRCGTNRWTKLRACCFRARRTVIVTAPRQPRALSADALASMTRHLAPRMEVVPDPAEALERALSGAAPEDAIFVTGSLYLAGDLRKWWNSRATKHAAASARGQLASS